MMGASDERRDAAAARGFKYRVAEGLSQLVSKLPDFVLARVVARMARTGCGTDACLEWGCLPLPVHFYSPVPDVDDLRSRNGGGRRSALPGIAFDEEGQVRRLRRLGSAFGEECCWPARLDGASSATFYTENSSFSFGCAASTHAMLRDSKPARVIEVGSGNSSKIILNALAMNQTEGHESEYTIIDPYPSEFIRSKNGGALKLY